MSNRLAKNGNGSGLVLPDNNDVLLELVVTRAGVQLKSPLPPNEVCKLLGSISVDVMYQSFKPAEVQKIHSV